MPLLASYFTQFLQLQPNKAPPLLLGTFQLLDSPAFCCAFLSFVAQESSFFLSFDEWLKLLKTDQKPPKKPDKDDPFLYQNPQYLGRNDLEAKVYRAYIYQKKLERYQAEINEIQQKEEQRRYLKNCYSLDEKGYCSFVFDLLDPKDQNFLKQRQAFFISEEERKRHTYISGGTGSGKSEIMKSLIYHYLTKYKNTALVLIDPHGKIAQEVAQFKENTTNQRLVFIAPDFDPTKTPIFNPFDMGKGVSPLYLDILVQELIGAFKEILQDIGFTPQMETLLKPCIATLLLYPNGNLYHLQQFMDEDESKELLAFALEHLPNPAQRQFLKNDFLKSSYAPSRQSIRTKLQSLLNSQIFLNFLIGKSSFSLIEAIEQKKLIIFSLSRNTGLETSDAIGRFLLSSLQSIAMQRASLDDQALEQSPDIHIFIDECQHYITPSIETILTETRKYKLYLTLANQFLDQIDSKRIKNAIKGNTALKITGRQTEPDTLAVFSKTIGIAPDTISNLKTGQYQAKAGTLEALKIEGLTKVLGNQNAMTKEEWEALKTEQLTRYYKSIHSFDDLPSLAEEHAKAKKTEKTRGLN